MRTLALGSLILMLALPGCGDPESLDRSPTSGGGGSAGHGAGGKAGTAGSSGSAGSVSNPKAPQVTIESPQSHSTVFGTSTVRFTATDDVGVSTLELMVDGVAVVTGLKTDTSFDWNTLGASDGLHDVAVRATDADGNHGEQAVRVTVSNALDLEADAPKGKWGKVTPIADGAHPNLFYNQSEVDELRDMVLVQHQPQHLHDLYQSKIKDVLAIPTGDEFPCDTNMIAALAYMLEPTPEKADAIRTSLFSFVSAFPNGGGTNGDAWYQTSGWWFSGYSVPWMFDLLLAYHPEKLTPSEVTELKQWFALTSSNFHAGHFVDEPGATYDREGKTVGEYANWWSRYLGNGFASALVSGDQSQVDYWADSGWPHGRFTYDGTTYTPSEASNRFDLIMTQLAVFPSGANADTYSREGYSSDTNEWYTTDYTWGAYHFAEMYGIITGAEMAFHNGMTGVFGITDAGSEPALLRTYKRAIHSRTELDHDPANSTGHPVIGYSPALFAGQRRYADPTLDAALPGVLEYAGPVPQNGTPDNREYDIPDEVWYFFGYPRRVVWKAP